MEVRAIPGQEHLPWAEAAIRSLNERYGYLPEPAEIVMRGPVAEDERRAT